MWAATTTALHARCFLCDWRSRRTATPPSCGRRVVSSENDVRGHVRVGTCGSTDGGGGCMGGVLLRHGVGTRRGACTLAIRSTPSEAPHTGEFALPRGRVATAKGCHIPGTLPYNRDFVPGDIAQGPSPRGHRKRDLVPGDIAGQPGHPAAHGRTPRTPGVAS